MVREYPDRPVVAIGVVIVEVGRVLLVRRGGPPRAGQWSLPGGGQELGETHVETAIREVREEAGLDIEVMGLVDVVDFVNRDDSGRIRYHYTLIDVLARPRGGTLVAGSDADEVRWFALNEIPTLGLWRETERVLSLGMEMAEALESADR